ncbi:LuxR C-terminal-related transcriptional regulator [uncultured Sunxiuqinia sp.]|uniref:LuxR C-terminal-related transcriptional regulator n=1 Tax=uncultured Sunxiuqinia sp. TaxID=1573825 RepID=UPI0030DA76E3
MTGKQEEFNWYNQSFDFEKLDYSLLDKHVEILESIKSVHSSAISIFDMARLQHAYLSSTFEDLLGWNLEEAGKPGHEYIDSRLHPEDLAHLNRVSSQFLELMLKVKKEDRLNMKHYKMIMDYRTKGKDGNYVRVIEQHKLLELDGDDNVWLALGIMDLSPDQDIQSLCRYRLVNAKTGDLYHFPKETPNTSLSLREQEILQLLGKGLISKQVADRLFISVNTVNTHRQRIIEKLNVSNITEAVRHAATIGII